MELRYGKLVPQHDFSKPRTFRLVEQRPGKTLDLGRNGVSVSADPLGRILQLSTYSSEHGIIVAAPYEQFDGSKFYDPLYVRAYRKRMLEYIQEGRPGFGVRIDDHTSAISIQHLAANFACVEYQTEGEVSVTVTLEVLANGRVEQTTEVLNSTASPKRVPYILDLGISVHRASYGQLTEGGPIPLPKCGNDLEILGDDCYFCVKNCSLYGHIEGCLYIDGKLIELSDVQSLARAAATISASSRGYIDVPGHSTSTIKVCLRLAQDTGFHGQFTIPSRDVKESNGEASWVDPDKIETFIIRRNLDYVVGNCAVPVSRLEVALVTDHVALPLGWNRDNFWQVRLLLKAMKHMDKIVTNPPSCTSPTALRKIVKGHLRWVFLRATRPHAFWHRSYLVSGIPKDGPVFQLDQQCYPFLELCDYYEQYPEDGDFIRDLLEESMTAEVIGLIVSKRQQPSGLLPTDETPGDDAVEYPFHFSSHVLLWYTISRLAEVVVAVKARSFADSSHLMCLADEVRSTALGHFLADRDGKPMLAYLTDGQGQHTFYHDANDIPTLFATKWGFLDSLAEKEAWRNTMDFAFSTANEKGYCSLGEYRGLGSVHSPGAWTLGYVQEFVYAQLTGNTAAESDAWRRIQAAMQWDGTFSEAVDPHTAQCTSKAWFSWPGAMIASALIDARSGVVGS